MPIKSKKEAVKKNIFFPLELQTYLNSMFNVSDLQTELRPSRMFTECYLKNFYAQVGHLVGKLKLFLRLSDPKIVVLRPNGKLRKTLPGGGIKAT